MAWQRRRRGADARVGEEMRWGPVLSGGLHGGEEEERADQRQRDPAAHGLIQARAREARRRRCVEVGVAERHGLVRRHSRSLGVEAAAGAGSGRGRGRRPGKQRLAQAVPRLRATAGKAEARWSRLGREPERSSGGGR